MTVKSYWTAKLCWAEDQQLIKKSTRFIKTKPLQCELSAASLVSAFSIGVDRQCLLQVKAVRKPEARQGIMTNPSLHPKTTWTWMVERKTTYTIWKTAELWKKWEGTNLVFSAWVRKGERVWGKWGKPQAGEQASTLAVTKDPSAVLP